jgi:hypothetical protein
MVWFVQVTVPTMMCFGNVPMLQVGKGGRVPENERERKNERGLTQEKQQRSNHTPVGKSFGHRRCPWHSGQARIVKLFCKY